jgi:hypothetical protein
MAKKILLARLKYDPEYMFSEDDNEGGAWLDVPYGRETVCKEGMDEYFIMKGMSNDIKVYGYTKPGVDRLAIKWDESWVIQKVNGMNTLTTFNFDHLLEEAYHKMGLSHSRTIYVEIEDA